MLVIRPKRISALWSIRKGRTDLTAVYNVYQCRSLYKTSPRDASSSSSYEEWIEKPVTGDSRKSENSSSHLQTPTHLQLARLSLASAFLFMKRLAKTRYHIPPELRIDEPNGRLTQDVLKCVSAGDYQQIALLLTHALEQEKLIVHPEVISKNVLEGFTSNEPVRHQLPLEMDIEMPMYSQASTASSPYYDYVYGKIPHLFDICKLYENFMFENQVFQDNYARFCYHMDNNEIMQQLIYVYLHNNKQFTPRTLSYFMANSILTFDIEYAKTLYETLISRGKGLHSEVLNTVIANLIKAGSIFENLGYIFSIWIANSSKCDLPDARTMALLLQQYYKYGQEDEVKLMLDMVESIGLSHNYLIQAVSLQAKISLREPGRFRKTITKEDLVEFNEICQTIENDADSLKQLHYSFLEYFAIRLDMKVIQFLLMSMKQYKIALDSSFYRVISEYYSQRGKFSPHFALLKKAAGNGLPYNDVFATQLFATFVRAYPYMAYEFSTQFHTWLESSDLPGSSKRSILQHTKIQKVESQLCPYNLAQNRLKSKKYTASWASIDWKHANSGRKFKSYKDQIDFRMNEGMKELINRGVKPDSSVLLTTFKRLNQKFRVDILEILKGFRMYLTADRFNIYNFQTSGSTDSLKQYFEDGQQSRLNSRDLLTLCRICLNNKLYDEARILLLLVKPQEMDDRSYMVRLALELSLALRERNFLHFIQVIDLFPVNEVILSPYIAKQCSYIEQRIARMIARHERKLAYIAREAVVESDVQIQAKLDTSTNTEAEAQADAQAEAEAEAEALKDRENWEMAAKAHVRITGLMGDIDARLAQDASDMEEEIVSITKFLDQWLSGYEIDVPN